MAEPRRQVRWTLGASNDLEDIIAYIAQDSPGTARIFLEQVLEAAESLSTLSHRGRVVPELEDPLVRQLLIKKYRLLYEVREAEVFVLSIIHGARDWSPG